MGAGVPNTYRYSKHDDPVAAPKSLVEWATKAEMGSLMLRERIEAMFERFEAAHRLRPGAAPVVLLDRPALLREL